MHRTDTAKRKAPYRYRTETVKHRTPHRNRKSNIRRTCLHPLDAAWEEAVISEAQSARGRARAHMRRQGSPLSCRCLTAHLYPSVNHGSQSRCLKRSRLRPHWWRRQSHRLGQWRASARARRKMAPRSASYSCPATCPGAPRRPRGGQLPRLRQGTYPPVRWARPSQARARVLPPNNGVGHGHGADPRLPRRARHRRRRPEAPRRPATSAPPSTAASLRSSQPADSLRLVHRRPVRHDGQPVVLLVLADLV